MPDPAYQSGGVSIYHGDVLAVLRQLPDGIVQTCVTSPPYWGLREYGVEGQLGLEPTPEEYVAKMVEIFREVRRVLRGDGTLWLNLGDSYAGNSSAGDKVFGNPEFNINRPSRAATKTADKSVPAGLKPKDLCGIPWSVAKALQQPYYSGRITKERDRVWLAATIDAEGTICGATHKRKDDGTIRTAIHIAITNTNTDMLDECYRIWPTSRREHNAHGPGHRGSLPIWRWIAHNVNEKAQLIRELYPYFVAKKRQALLAWNFFEMSKRAKCLGGGGISDSDRERRSWIMNALSDLNHARNVDVPTWIREPPRCEEPGWYLRSDIIWSKKNPMPSSVTDRPTTAHEYIFLMSKAARYYYDADAVREDSADVLGRTITTDGASWSSPNGRLTNPGDKEYGCPTAGRNRRTVWQCEEWQLVENTEHDGHKPDVWGVATQPYKAAHFATYPARLIEPAILAGATDRACAACGKPWRRVVEATKYEPPSAEPGERCVDASRGDKNRKLSGKDYNEQVRRTTKGFAPDCKCGTTETRPSIVLDPFMGSGTTAEVARKHGCEAIGIELNAEYIKLAGQRLAQGVLELGG